MQKNNTTDNGFDHHERFSVYANHETIGLGSILFFWFASMWIYTVPAVTQHIYGTTDTTSEAYNTVPIK
jgi:maltose/moltooligosaccharide transporter